MMIKNLESSEDDLSKQKMILNRRKLSLWQ